MQALNYLKAAGLAVALTLAPAVWADDDNDTEGRIESIDRQSRSFVVNGMRIHADRHTDYDDDLHHFSDLRVGQKVEVDYANRNGRRLATEIELDD